MRIALKPHPDTPSKAIEAIEVEFERLGAGGLSLRYLAHGTIADVLVPACMRAERADELWRHTCFEAFVRPLGGQSYFELNLAPSSRWAAYGFSGYRTGMRVAHEVGVEQIATQAGDKFYELHAVLAGLPAGACRLGLSTVIEERDGLKSYWALVHTHGKPDFHHHDAFALELS